MMSRWMTSHVSSRIALVLSGGLTSSDTGPFQAGRSSSKAGIMTSYLYEVLKDKSITEGVTSGTMKFCSPLPSRWTFLPSVRRGSSEGWFSCAIWNPRDRTCLMIAACCARDYTSPGKKRVAIYRPPCDAFRGVRIPRWKLSNRFCLFASGWLP
jgi:hypothetical protein